MRYGVATQNNGVLGVKVIRTEKQNQKYNDQQRKNKAEHHKKPPYTTIETVDSNLKYDKPDYTAKKKVFQQKYGKINQMPEVSILRTLSSLIPMTFVIHLLWVQYCPFHSLQNPHSTDRRTAIPQTAELSFH